MNLPKYHETFIPILKILSAGTSIHYKTLCEKVIQAFYADLPQSLLAETTKTGANLLHDRIGWGKSHLRMAKMVAYPTRGHVQITDKGRKILQSGQLTFKDFKNDPDVIAHDNQKTLKKKNDNDTPARLFNDKSPQDLLDTAYEQIEISIKEKLLEILVKINPYQFERIVLKLLKEMGYGDPVETPKSHDEGIDGIINEDQLGLEKIYIQAKRYSDIKVRETDIRNFIGAMSSNTHKGIFITTSFFDEKAKQKAREAQHKIILIDREKLIDLMYQWNIGVFIETNYEIKEIDENFFEAE